MTFKMVSHTLCSCTICCSLRFCSLRACANPSGHEIIEIFVVTCDGVLIVRIVVDCIGWTIIRDVLFGSTNFEFIVFGEMLSEERTFDVVVISAMYGGGFELNELCLRRYRGIVVTIPFPFGTGAVVDIN